MFICLFVRFYLFLNLQVSWYDMVPTVKKLILTSSLTRAISFPVVRTTTFGQSVYLDIALHISNYYIDILLFTQSILLFNQYITTYSNYYYSFQYSTISKNDSAICQYIVIYSNYSAIFQYIYSNVSAIF